MGVTVLILPDFLSQTLMMFLRWCFPPVRRMCVCQQISVRSFSSSRTLLKDDPQHEEKLDLDIWKSVMRAQALPEDPPHLQDSTSAASVLEAHRELVETWHQAGKLVPKVITDQQLQELSILTTKSSKKKYLKFLAIKEAQKNNDKRKQEKKRAEREAGKLQNNNGEEEERAAGPENTFMLRLRNNSIESAHNWRTAQAMRFDQPLVFDMSYDQQMSRHELENTVSQLLESEGFNRRVQEPFHLHFCNLQPGGAYHRELLRRYGDETWRRLLITHTERSPLELFPHQDLVYLTADSRSVLRTFDHTKVYIVGAMVDRSIRVGASLAIAKRFRLATARLPLDEYLDWDCGAKNLTLDQMIRILTTVKQTGCWQKALEFVPKRKHKGFHQQSGDKRSQKKHRGGADRAPWWSQQKQHQQK